MGILPVLGWGCTKSWEWTRLIPAGQWDIPNNVASSAYKQVERGFWEWVVNKELLIINQLVVNGCKWINQPNGSTNQMDLSI